MRLRSCFFAVLGFCAMPPALAEEACSLRAPDPVLRPGAYAGQTLTRQTPNMTRETARKRRLAIEIRQSGCEDFVTTSITLRVPRNYVLERSEDQWIDFARDEIGLLQTRDVQRRFAGVVTFLGKAHGIAPRRGERAICRDGTMPPASNECSWDSLGGYRFSVKHTQDDSVITVTEYISA